MEADELSSKIRCSIQKFAVKKQIKIKYVFVREFYEEYDECSLLIMPDTKTDKYHEEIESIAEILDIKFIEENIL
jgi:hypothetical protein